MADIINIQDRQRRSRIEPRIILKEVDGEIIECVNIDELPPQQQARYLGDPGS